MELERTKFYREEREFDEYIKTLLEKDELELTKDELEDIERYNQKYAN